MALIVHGSDNGSEILRAMGLDPDKVVKADIHFRPRGLVTIVAEIFVDVDRDKLLTELKKFRLEPVEDEPGETNAAPQS